MRSRFPFQWLLAGVLPLCLAGADGPLHRRPQPSAPDARIRVDTNLVLVPVVVTDRRNRPVAGLRRDDFRIFEDNREQSIAHFSEEDLPLSAVIVLDTSGSMRPKLRQANRMLSELLKVAGPEDEFALVRVRARPELLVPFTPDTAALQNQILFDGAQGRTALLDSLSLAAGMMRQARNARRAIIVITDGADNNSRTTLRELRNAILESDIQVYSIGFSDPLARLTSSFSSEDTGATLLADIASESGGRHYSLEFANELPQIAAKIGAELHNQYLIAYSPSNSVEDGRYRRIKVTIPNPGQSRVSISSRRGYFAPGR